MHKAVRAIQSGSQRMARRVVISPYSRLALAPSLLPASVMAWVHLRDQVFAWGGFLHLAGAPVGRAARASSHTPLSGVRPG